MGKRKDGRPHGGSKHGTRVAWRCTTCGKLEASIPSEVRKYCSRECQYVGISGSSIEPTICVGCGVTFMPKATNRLKYCSRECAFRDPARPPKRPRAVAAPRSRVLFKECPRCGRTFTVRYGNNRKKYCSEPCIPKRIRTKPERPAMPRERLCLCCAAPFRPLAGRAGAKLCSELCRSVTRREARRKDSRGSDRHRGRARAKGVAYEPISIKEVLRRDGWVCRICSAPITQAYPHPMCPSLDHVVPISKGGPHLYSNVQAAHWACNTAKGNREPRA